MRLMCGTALLVLVCGFGCNKKVAHSQARSEGGACPMRLDPEGRLVVDAKGADGAEGGAGARGMNGNDAFSPGSHGSGGGPGMGGGPGIPGQRGGTIRVTLSSPGGSGFVLQGEKESGGRREGVNLQGDVVRQGYVVFDVRGGRGGKGGSGGDGGSGGAGAKGADAAPFSPGGNGGNGGPGGDGGRGGQAGPGGDGGLVEVTVAESQSELLWLVKTIVEGGPSGEAGFGGAGGEGGRWGAPGLPYAGTVNGQTLSHPGGHAGDYGPPGRRGENGQKPQDGRAGQASVILKFDDGRVQTFPRIFDPQVTDVALAEEFADGVLEPGETFSVTGFRVRNASEMPTPRKPTVFSLVEQGDVGCPSRPVEVTLPEGLGGNAEQAFSFPPGAHVYKVSESTGSGGGEIRFNPGVSVGHAQKGLPGSQIFPVSSPLKFETDSAVTLVVQNQKANRVVRVRNESRALYGGGGRRARVRLSLDAPTPAGNGLRVTFAQFYGTLAQPFEMDLPLVAPGQKWEMPLDVEMDPHVDLGASANLRLELLLAPPSGGEPSKLVEKTVLPFTHTLDPAWEFNYHANVKDAFFKCKFLPPNARERQIDEVWVQKAKGSDKLFVKFDHTWWVGGSNDSPLFEVDLNASAAYLGVLNGMVKIDDAILQDLFEHLVIPASRSAQDAWRIESCRFDVERRNRRWWQYAGVY